MLRLRVLGGSEISWRGAPVTGLGAQGLALLCYLATVGGLQARPRLAAALWPDQASRALTALAAALRELDEALPGCLVAAGDSLGVDPDISVEVDAQRFAELAARGLAGDAEALRAAARLYGGELLAGVAPPDAPGLVAWLQREREALRELADRCAQALGASQAGQPAPEAPAERPHLPHNLPAHREALIGRAEEVDAVCATLRQPDVRLLTLIGPGGVGKTGLAQQVAAQLLDDVASFRDGVSFVDLSAVGDGERVTATIVRALNIRPQSDSPALTAVEGELRDRRLLLVLDNFEQVADAAPQVGALLAACPGVKVLVTSRRRLRLRDERIYPVPPLAVPPLSPLPSPQQVAAYPAVALLVQRARTALPTFQLDAGNAAALAAICARVDGLPLAIELAAPWLRLFPPQTLLDRLGTRLNLLSGGARDVPLRQQTLRATLDWSYTLLGEDERRLFAHLAVFVGGFTAADAEAVCTAPIGTLAALLDHSLLAQEAGADGEPRLRMLETIRAYALEQLLARGEARALRERHARYWCARAEAVEELLQGPDQATWLNWLEANHENLRAALGWGVASQEPEVAVRIAAALAEFWWPRGHLSEGRRWLARALGRYTAPTPARAKALYHAGELAYGQNDQPTALALLEESLELYRALGDRRGAACVLRSRGNVRALLGDERAAADRQESLALFRELGDRWGMAWMLLEIGRDEPVPARQRELLLQSLEQARAGGYPRTEATALGNLGKLARAEGQRDEARRLFEEALGIGRELRDTWLSALMLYHLSQLAEDEGDELRARALRHESQVLLSRFDFRA